MVSVWEVSQIVNCGKEEHQDQQVGQALTRLCCNMEQVLPVQRFSWSLTDIIKLELNKGHFKTTILNIHYSTFTIKVSSWLSCFMINGSQNHKWKYNFTDSQGLSDTIKKQQYWCCTHGMCKSRCSWNFGQKQRSFQVLFWVFFVIFYLYSPPIIGVHVLQPTIITHFLVPTWSLKLSALGFCNS